MKGFVILDKCKYTWATNSPAPSKVQFNITTQYPKEIFPLISLLCPFSDLHNTNRTFPPKIHFENNISS